jgi:hypothetical protein
VGELVRNSMKMSDCERQRIDKPTIYRAFWNAYHAGYLPNRMYRRKGFIGQSQQNYFVRFIETIILGDDEAYSDFRPNIASLQNLVAFKYERAFSWSTTTSP